MMLEFIVDDILRTGLAEDLGSAGDLTSQSVVPGEAMARGEVVARDGGVIAGLGFGLRTFGMVDPGVECDLSVDDGARVAAGTTLAIIRGPARGILTAERTCLNLLGRLSGIATATAELVERAGDDSIRIADTRKTLPGWRALEKYAVRMGGGSNHRFGLHDAVMIKDNHLVVVGDLTEAVARARSGVGHTVTIEVEVTTVEGAVEAVEAGADVILLDNMDNDTMRQAVESVAGRAVVEASGGITSATVAGVASTGVDVISVGWITHSAPNLDVALDFVPL